MNSDPSNTQQIRYVYLPSGKKIEIVYFLGHASEARHSPPPQASPGAARPEVSTRENLHVCPSCSSDMVHPMDWSEMGSEHWQVSLRCAECEWRQTAVFGQKQVERFDALLDDGAQLLLDDLQQLTHANMSDEIERFVKALHAGHILPCDF